MEPIESSETSAYNNTLTPGTYPKEKKLTLISLHSRFVLVLWAIPMWHTAAEELLLTFARTPTSFCSSNNRLTLVTASAFVSNSWKMSLSILVACNAKFSIYSLSEIFSIRAEVQLRVTSSVQFTACCWEFREVNLPIEGGWYMNGSGTWSLVPIGDDCIILHLLV